MGVAVDDTHYYVPSRDDRKYVQKNAPAVFAHDKKSGDYKVYIVSDIASKGWWIYSVAVTDKFVIGTNPIKDLIVVWDKATTAEVSFTSHYGCGAISANGDK